MKTILFVAFVGALAANALSGQTLAKSDTRTTPKASNEELNLEAYVKLLRTDVNKQKAQIVATVMQFDAPDAAVFWPIYKDFQSDLSTIGDRTASLVQTYVSSYNAMTPDVADKLANQLLNIEEQRTELKRKYYVKLKTALDPITAARFLQVENQIERVIDLQIASHLPVVGGNGK